MLHHYITRYQEDGSDIVEAWLQFNFFNWCLCFSRRKKILNKKDNHSAK